MPTSTPWGPAQTSRKIAPGIMEYTTASHGGIHLSPTKNVQVHPAWRRSEGWYEEDVAYCIVILTFPQFFRLLRHGVNMVEWATATAKDWLPLQYMQVSGQKVDESESFKLREMAAYAALADRWVALSAYGDWKNGVPRGKVAVVATQGGQRRIYNQPAPPERWFLVDFSRYTDDKFRTPIGYVVNEEVDTSIDPLT